MKFALAFITLLWFSNSVRAQTSPHHGADSANNKKTLLCRYWHLTQWENTDKNMYWATTEMAENWIKYNPDGTFTDKETKETYTGKWVFDEDKMIITLTQTKSKEYPAKMQLKVTKLTKARLEATADDFSGNPATRIIMEPGIYKAK